MIPEPRPRRPGLLESANYALLGVIHAFRTERSLRIHFLSAAFVLLLAVRLGVTRTEMVLLLLVITFVFMAEMINTTVEILTNAFVDGKNPAAKSAKDVAAGSVLVAVVGAVFVGYLVFFDRIRNFSPALFRHIQVIPLHVSIVSLVLVILTTIILKTFSGHGTPLRGGMPSGHAALAFSAATIILWFSKDLLIVSAAFLLAGMVAQSRVDGKLHTGWEVTGGALIGLLFTLAILKAFLSPSP